MQRFERLPSGVIVPKISRRQLMRAGLAAGVFLGTRKARAAWLMNPYRFGSPPAISGASSLAMGETEYLAIDFAADQTMLIKDLTTPANDYTGLPDDKLTYTAPSPKLCRQSDGVFRYGAHNLYLNSAAPANQAVSVTSGATYAITITGTVSIAWTGAFTGTTNTPGTTTFTAATGTLTGGSTSGSGTVQVYRTPAVATYIATTGTTKYALPYEWDTSGVLQGILPEEARTNGLLRSREFDNAAWVKTNMTVTADSIAGFDGQTLADTLAATAANATISQNGAANSTNDARHATVFLKRKTGTGTVTLEVGHVVTTCVLDATVQRFERRGAGLTGTYAVVSNVNTVTATGHGLVTGDAVRIDITSGAAADTSQASVTVDDANTFHFAQVTADTSGNVTIYANCLRIKLATSGDEVYADMAQLEVRTLNGQNFATSPIITTTATVTRAADNIKIATSLFPFSATQGSAYAKFLVRNSNATTRTVIDFSDGTANESISLRATTSRSLVVVDGGTQVVGTSSGAVTPDSFERLAVRWALNDFASSGNGAAVSTDVSGTLPTVNSLQLGDRGSANSIFIGYLAQVLYVPRLMSNAELISRSTP